MREARTNGAVADARERVKAEERMVGGMHLWSDLLRGFQWCQWLWAPRHNDSKNRMSSNPCHCRIPARRGPSR